MSDKPRPNFAMRNPHGMVDIETLDTKHTAAIVSIGAVIFDPFHLDTVESIRKHTYYARVNPEDAVNRGCTMSASTVMWWMGLPKHVQDASFKGESVSLLQAMQDVRNFFQDGPVKPNFIWAQDPDFDCKILEHAAERTRERWPFPFYQGRSCRTIYDLAWPNGDKPDIRVGDHHNALDDAITQALLVQTAILRLGQNQTWEPEHADAIKAIKLK